MPRKMRSAGREDKWADASARVGAEAGFMALFPAAVKGAGNVGALGARAAAAVPGVARAAGAAAQFGRGVLAIPYLGRTVLVSFQLAKRVATSKITKGAAAAGLVGLQFRQIHDNLMEGVERWRKGDTAGAVGAFGAAGVDAVGLLATLQELRKAEKGSKAAEAETSEAPTKGEKLFGLREWEVAPGQEAKAAKALEQLEAAYFKATGKRPVVLDADHPQGALGYINPENGRIELYSGERFGSAARAEELFHYQQLKARGLLGTPEDKIPLAVKQELEKEVEGMLRNAGFQPKR